MLTAAKPGCKANREQDAPSSSPCPPHDAIRNHGVRRQSAAATALWLEDATIHSACYEEAVSQSGVAPRLPPQSIAQRDGSRSDIALEMRPIHALHRLSY